MFFESLKPNFKKYQKQILKNAKALSDSLKKFGFNLVTNGTDNHLMLLDLRNLSIGGLEAEKKLESININANRNTIPGDTSPFKPSGLRLGTPAVTTRGMKETEMKKIAKLIHEVLVKKGDNKILLKEVELFCKKFPLPH